MRRRVCVASALAVAAGLALAGCHRGHGRRLFVTNEDDGTVSVIDLDARKVSDTISVGKRPRGVRVSRDGKWLYVAVSGSPKAGPGVDESTLPPADRSADGIAMVALDDLRVERVLPSGQDPESFDLIDDRRLAISNEETAQTSILDIENRRFIAQVPVGREPEGVTAAPDHTVWVTSEGDRQIAVIDPQAAQVIATIATGDRPRSIAFTPDGARALISNENDASITVVDVATRRATGRIVLSRQADAPTPPRPMGIAIAPDGKRAYVTTGRDGGVTVIDLAAPPDSASAIVATIRHVGARPWGIAIAPGGLVATANGPSNDVSLIDPATQQVVARVPVGRSPWGIAAAP